MFTYDEHVRKMNATEANPTIAAAAAALKDLGISADLARPRSVGSDIAIVLRTPTGPHEYRAEVKRHVSRALLGSIKTTFAREHRDSLLVTDYVTPPLADEFRRGGIQFVDGAGNVFLQRPELFVFVTGRKPAEARRSVRTPRVFRGAGLKTIFALLSKPELVNTPHREIAAAATVALGSVPTILDGLRRLGFLDDIRGERRLLDRERLLQHWTEAYAQTFEAELDLARFRAPDPKWWRRADVTRHSAQWGGETAAALLHRQLVPERAVVYAARVPPKMVVEHRLKADPNGDVVFRLRFWNFEVPWKRKEVVPPLLVYADLIAAGDGRSLTAARQIHDEFLARSVESR
jgi:hypothetical protein